MSYTPPPHGFRTFVIVWAAQSLSVIGSGMTGFALNVYLAQVLYAAPEQKVELALAFTALSLGFTIPFVFGGPLAGAYADRHDRKQIMIVANVANGLTTALTLALMLAGSLQSGCLWSSASSLQRRRHFTTPLSMRRMRCWYRTACCPELTA